ncbi:flagellar type III secretion system protein FlhB [Rhodocyclus tenuis]|uniref:Flagellar biosynthetic protein FlhB n=2 Tax=Rhodocyclus TaxID=1064 RepID=A0A6L5JYF7_RHOTE|nr:flagellar biosynthesis protein FlhB [Rhodocyclus gracilis]MQY51620.1 flagellar type III secretion system protein FlhB [Rhodocyclus gracilis]NJA89121.1 flagellar type III secretion system protein FlhB [Rhodocyclus gracilis]
MAEDSDLERTEPASGRRLDQAREQGQVPRSREVGAFLVLIVGAATLWALGPWVVQRSMALLRHGLILESPLLHEPQQMLVRLTDVSYDALLVFSPILLALILAALISPFFLGSWVFSTQALVPDLTRLDPIKGLARLISWSGLVELLKAVAKAGLIAGIAAWVIWSERGQIFSLYDQSLQTGMAGAGNLLVFSFFAVVAAMLLIVAVDVPFQLWQYYDKLKMTRQEVRDEFKQMEGDPKVKGRIRSMQREAARRRMMGAVPNADVIVTNPTHFAVALAYSAGMKAPKVIAKGRGEVALKIREIGAANGVPMLEAPPLARALYKHVELDQEIAVALYAAVAEVLAYVHQLSQWRRSGGQYPAPPREIAVPAELVPEVQNG